MFRRMLREILTRMTTSCPTSVRDLGYLDEAVAMRRRATQNRTAWQPHLDRSRGFVLASAERCADRTSVVVLGCGLLLDVPLAELSAMFHTVVLSDIIILPEVRRDVRRYGNISLRQHDVTGAALPLHKNLSGLRVLPQPEPSLPPHGEMPGLVVSLNILSQLWVVPRAYARARIPGLDEEQLDDWCGQLVASHLAMLRSLPCPACLIADHEFVKRDRSGSVISRDSTVYRVPIGTPDDSWTWNIVPMQGNSRHLTKTLAVGAWHDY